MPLKKKTLYHYSIFCLFLFVLNACSSSKKTGGSQYSTTPEYTVPVTKETPSEGNTTSVNIDGLLWFAKQQLGTPYKYGSADPKKGGFDCSGFLFYVFTHFKITVPRSSYDYMTFGNAVSKQNARKGDVIIFTGSDATQKTGGHVGIILETRQDDISFIHGSTTKGVIINKLSDAYYAKRFLKIVRVIY